MVLTARCRRASSRSVVPPSGRRRSSGGSRRSPGRTAGPGTPPPQAAVGVADARQQAGEARAAAAGARQLLWIPVIGTGTAAGASHPKSVGDGGMDWAGILLVALFNVVVQLIGQLGQSGRRRTPGGSYGKPSWPSGTRWVASPCVGYIGLMMPEVTSWDISPA